MDIFFTANSTLLIDENHALSFLDTDEIEAASHFTTPELRAYYITQRALIYRTLSQLTGRLIRKSSLSIVNGKPFLKEGPFFSYSHSEHSLCLAINERPVGLDLEPLNRKIDTELFSYITPLKGMNPISYSEEFICYWTIIESYFKFTGYGLPSELKEVQISKINNLYNIFYRHLPHGQVITIEHDTYNIAICSDQILSSHIKISDF